MKNKKLEPIQNSLEKWQTAIHLFEENAHKSIISLDKFDFVLTDLVEEETSKLYKLKPKMPLSKVIATVFMGINENTPPDLLVKMTQLIIKTWSEQKANAEQYSFA